MRYIFMDEAGTSAKEPVTVVVGIIAHADEHVLPAEALIKEFIGAVPARFRKDFVFHATEVFGGKKYRDEWSMTDRLKLLNSMMGVPRRIGMAICLSVLWRGAVDYKENSAELGLRGEQFDHVMAFGSCLAVADRNIRQFAAPNEVAAVVAEDVPELRSFLKVLPRFYREHPTHLAPRYLRQTITDSDAGYLTQSGEFRVTRIRNSVHFVEKAEDPLVQVADACAYGLRRFFAKESFGLDFVKSILGHEDVLRDFAPPGGIGCFWPSL